MTNIIDSEAKLAEIEQREVQARKGKWAFERKANGACQVYDVEEYTTVALMNCTVDAPQNASFIAHARTDIPALCATIRQLWERDRWIPASERLPEPGVAVLIGYGTVVEWGYFRNPKYRGPRAAKWHNQHRPTDLVTHWRPLPAPPPETEEQP